MVSAYFARLACIAMSKGHQMSKKKVLASFRSCLVRKKEPRVSNACPSSLHVFYVCVCLSAFVQRLLSGRPIELSEMIARHAYFIFGATTAAEARIGLFPLPAFVSEVNELRGCTRD